MPLDGAKTAAVIRALMQEYATDNESDDITDAEILQSVSETIRMLDADLPTDL